MPEKQHGFWTPANIITVGRMFLIPVVMYFLFEPQVRQPWAGWTAMVIFVVAGVLDLVDGWLARRYKQVSVVGTFLDPLADKLMVTTVMIMLLPLDRIPAWLVVILITRELVITGLRGLASAEGIIISASSGGKYKTAYQTVGLSYLMIHDTYMGIDCHVVGLWLLTISAGISLWSGWEYCREFAKMSKLRGGGSPAGA
jgi:CDP-diacylglycerol---glycerol-3-phosphate 3-phosphatidyltransferase